MRKQAIAFAVLAVILGLLAVGCGGDDSSDGGATAAGTGASSNDDGATGAEGGSAAESSPEKDAFTTEVNADCLKSVKKARAGILKAYASPANQNASNDKEAVEFEADFLVPILITDAENRINAIGASTAPSGDEAEIGAIHESLEKWIEKAEKTPVQIVYSGDIFDEARELAGKYPLVKCGLSPFEEL